jgi:hypothetical protein
MPKIRKPSIRYQRYENLLDPRSRYKNNKNLLGCSVPIVHSNVWYDKANGYSRWRVSSRHLIRTDGQEFPSAIRQASELKVEVEVVARRCGGKEMRGGAGGLNLLFPPFSNPILSCCFPNAIQNLPTMTRRPFSHFFYGQCHFGCTIDSTIATSYIIY